MAIVCKRVHYSGQVQGVGFRYTTQGLAAGHPVAGYVRNLPTGEVELVAEGEAEHVAAFLRAVAQRMASYIADARTEDLPPSGQHGFRIRH
jgi:acylphosphatase